MKLSQLFRFCNLCGRNGLKIEIGDDGLCPNCRAEKERLALERAETEKRERIAAEERSRKRFHFCRKCLKNALEVEIPDHDRVCVECRKKYPCMRSPLRSTSPTFQNSYIISLDFIRDCRKRFIAFDVETTGLKSWQDKIIEISAVIFENFIPVATFSSLINPETHIPGVASDVNGIYDEDVIDAPYIYEAIENFCNFIGKDSLEGRIPMVAHNADFDIKFLLHAFSDCGIDANILLQDTLYISRWMNRELQNHKLSTVAAYLGVEQQQAHRAADDARVCGEIFAKMLLKREPRLMEKKNQLIPIELAICEWLKSTVEAEGLNTQLLTVKSAKTYCSIKYISEIVRIKARGRKPYILIPAEFTVPDALEIAPATKSEGESNNRVFFTELQDLYPLREYLVARYKTALSHAIETVSQSERAFQLASENATHEIFL